MKSEWITVKLSEITSIIGDGLHGTPQYDENGEYYFINGNNLKDGKIVIKEDTKRVSFEEYLKYKKDLNDRTLFVSINGTIGNIGAYNGEKIILGKSACYFNVNLENDKDFIQYVVTNKSFQNYIQLNATGTTIKNVSLKLMRDYEFLLPPIDVQKKISSILRAIDNKIDCNNQMNDNLEQQAQAMFQYLFIENSSPEWPMGTILDIGTVIGGSTPSKSKPEYYSSKGIAWITPKDLSNNKSKFITRGENDITELGLKNSSAMIMPKGTVLFSSRAPIGYIAIANGEVTTNQGFKSVVPHDHIGTAFVYYFLKHNLQIIENMASGSTFKEISGAVMKSVPAQIPDNETLKHFTHFCAAIFNQQEHLEYESAILAMLRDSLLTKLMSRELDVSDIDI